MGFFDGVFGSDGGGEAVKTGDGEGGADKASSKGPSAPAAGDGTPGSLKIDEQSLARQHACACLRLLLSSYRRFGCEQGDAGERRQLELF